MRVFLCLILLLGAPIVSAHDRNDTSIKIVQWVTKTDRFLMGLIENTHSGSRIRCALYDESGQVLGVQTQRTKEFATEFHFDHRGFDVADLKTYRCAYVD